MQIRGDLPSRRTSELPKLPVTSWWYGIMKILPGFHSEFSPKLQDNVWDRNPVYEAVHNHTI